MTTDKTKKIDIAEDLSIGEKVRELRKKRHFTLKELSSKSGLPQSLLREIEKDATIPLTATLSKLSQALNVNVSYFHENFLSEAPVRNSDFHCDRAVHKSYEAGPVTEVRLCGRGGQGTVIASIILARAFFRSGYQVKNLAELESGKEGAPVETCLKLAKKTASIEPGYVPDHLIIYDRTLLQHADITKGLKPGGWILINTPEAYTGADSFLGFTPAYIDANRIARSNKLGSRSRPIVHTAMMGAFAALLGVPPLEYLLEAIEEEMSLDIDLNIQAAEEAYTEVRRPLLIS